MTLTEMFNGLVGNLGALGAQAAQPISSRTDLQKLREMESDIERIDDSIAYYERQRDEANKKLPSLQEQLADAKGKFAAAMSEFKAKV